VPKIIGFLMMWVAKQSGFSLFGHPVVSALCSAELPSCRYEFLTKR